MNSRLRILHVVPTYLPAYRYGGPVKSVHGLCRGLARLGHEVHVFTTNVDGAGDSRVPLGTPVAIDGVQVWYFPSRWLRRLYWSPSMARMLRERVGGFDLLHLHALYLWPPWAAARTARKAGVPYLVSPRGMLVKELVRRKSRLIKSLWLALIEKGKLEGAAALHVTSNQEAVCARAFGFRLPPLRVVPNGVDSEEASGSAGELSPAVAGVLGKPRLLLFLGRVNWKKGLDRLIPALLRVPEAHLAIAGNDEENYRPVLEKLASRHGVGDRITFTGPAGEADKAALFRRARVLVLPSYSENFGNVVLEAMAAGCPVAVTPEVGAADIVAAHGAGVVLPGEPESFGTGVQAMLADLEGLARMGSCGRRAVQEHFGWQAVAAEMTAVYRELLAGEGESHA